ncbi:hypothetical protein CLV40_108117 [Actinokineospora auranticolor]|uniref:Uncharacterized protein n=1 Tax=Actinokineospora auranticolor TaxID=155976 RepID=A0A2S6GPM0_9PSEU|nr:hypothetical protein CLV40_108117 [Actinokineospora auranticolor]
MIDSAAVAGAASADIAEPEPWRAVAGWVREGNRGECHAGAVVGMRRSGCSTRRLVARRVDVSGAEASGDQRCGQVHRRQEADGGDGEARGGSGGRGVVVSMTSMGAEGTPAAIRRLIVTRCAVGPWHWAAGPKRTRRMWPEPPGSTPRGVVRPSSTPGRPTDSAPNGTDPVRLVGNARAGAAGAEQPRAPPPARFEKHAPAGEALLPARRSGPSSWLSAPAQASPPRRDWEKPLCTQAFRLALASVEMLVKWRWSNPSGL